MIHHTPIDSENISHTIYNDSSKELRIVFHKTPLQTYLYSEIYKSVYDDFIKNKSPERFFNDNIKSKFKAMI